MMPGHRWRSTAAGWLRSAADILSPAGAAAAQDHARHGGGYPAQGPARAAGRTFDLDGAPEHWVKLLRDAGLSVGSPETTEAAGSQAQGSQEVRPQAPAREAAASPVPPRRPGDSPAARSRRAVAADAGPATGSGQTAAADAGAGSRRPRAAGDLRLPQLLIGRRAGGRQPASQKTGTQATPQQQVADPQGIHRLDPGPGSGLAPPASGTPGRASRSRGRSARPADPTPASGPYQPVSLFRPETSPAQPIPAQQDIPTQADLRAQPDEPAQPHVPPPAGLAGLHGLTGLPGLPVVSGPPAQSRPATTRPPTGGAVRHPGRAAVGTFPPHVPQPTVPNGPGPAMSSHPLERAGGQYPVPGPGQPARGLSPALAGEWPELPLSLAVPAINAAPERVEQALARNFRLRDEQGAV